MDKVIELDFLGLSRRKKDCSKDWPSPSQARIDSRSAASTATTNMPSLVAADFNYVEDVRKKLHRVILDDDGNDDEEDFDDEWYRTFVFERVVIYLNEGVPSLL